MDNVSAADQLLIEQINNGDDQAWSELVRRYQGRLQAFAESRLKGRSDAEDAVQETFIALVKGLKTYRGQASLETYLFSIIRRKIIDGYRSQAARRVCLLQDIAAQQTADSDSSDMFQHLPAETATASWYVSKDEQRNQLHDILAQSLHELVGRYKKSLSFRELKIVELLFYCHMPNKEIAALNDVSENQIAVIKHRCLKRVRASLAEHDLAADSDMAEAALESLLTQVWEEQRLSCPKRSTLGAYVLGTLEPDWQDYLDFHLHTLGCHFCRANLEDLQRLENAADQEPIRQRILQSTVGFLHKP